MKEPRFLLELSAGRSGPGRDGLSKRHAKLWTRRRALQERPPENGWGFGKKGSQVWKDDSRRKKKIPLRVVTKPVKVHAGLQPMSGPNESETVGNLHARF